MRGTLRVDADLEVGERVTPVCIAAVLADQDLRRNCRTSGGTTAWKPRSQPASACPPGARRSPAEPSAAGPPVSVGRPGTGEKRRPGLMHADRQDPRLVLEGSLNAVPVMHVDVDVGDALDATPRAARR